MTPALTKGSRHCIQRPAGMTTRTGQSVSQSENRSLGAGTWAKAAAAVERAEKSKDGERSWQLFLLKQEGLGD